MRAEGILLAAGCLVVLCSHVAAGYEEIDVKDGGRIAGQVRIVGEIPALPPLPVYKYKEHCGVEVADERLVLGKEGALRDTVVYLANVKAGKRIDRSRPVTMDNAKCAFVPHVASGSLGQTLEFHNSDPFLHDAHAWLGTRTLFNRAIPKGRTIRQPLTDAGLIHINCNVRHTWMHAYLYVAEHPYHAVTGPDGRFAIDEIPPGTYTLVTWQELLGSSEREVKVEGGKTTQVEVELSAVGAETSEAQY